MARRTALPFVRAKIVHDHNVAGLQVGTKNLVEVELEGLAVDRLIDIAAALRIEASPNS
jgi:hypothetical protein